MNTISILMTLSLSSVITSSLQTPEGPGEYLAKMMKKGEIYAAPSDQHSFLERFTGTWTTSSIVMDTEPQKGTSKNTMILGGRFLEMGYQGDFLGIELEGKVTLGFDNYKHKFTVVYIDNLNTSTRTAEGILDKSGDVLTLWGTTDEWMTDEHDKPVMYRYTMRNPSTIVFEVHDLSIVSGETKVIEVTYTKEHIANDRPRTRKDIASHY
ncbi:MAG: DUF1579 family protein [Phycisphaerae bacterium]|jgi:hypothetical protein|nr:DUF1579 family protein [Phycisphaerae bacterium]